jgi:hypothetical protein
MLRFRPFDQDVPPGHQGVPWEETGFEPATPRLENRDSYAASINLTIRSLMRTRKVITPHKAPNGYGFSSCSMIQPAIINILPRKRRIVFV